MAEKMYEPMVKADVDINKGIMIIDMPMHVDGEQQLLESGSSQSDLWGINLHPKDFGTDQFVEFDSMINIRPSDGNTSRYIEDEDTRSKILGLVEKIVIDE